MPDRYYHPAGFNNNEVVLDGGEWHHFANVKRGRVGDVVELFDGAGVVATAEVIAAAKKRGTLRITAVDRPTSDAGRRLTIATAVPKGERFRWLVEKAAELGVRRLVPLITERSVVEPGAGKLSKARQWAIEAAKQSRNAHLMEIPEPTDWASLHDSSEEGEMLFVAHPGGQPIAECFHPFASLELVTVAIGPEGGWTNAEIELSQQKRGIPVGLGESILRIETAVVAVASYVRLAGTMSDGSNQSAL